MTIFNVFIYYLLIASSWIHRRTSLLTWAEHILENSHMHNAPCAAGSSSPE